MDENTGNITIEEIYDAQEVETEINEDNQNIIFKCEFAEQPIEQYKYAEIFCGRIISIHRHFMPLHLFRRLFVTDRKSEFIDILPAEQASGFEAQIGDYVYHDGEGTLRIEHPVYPDTVEGAQLQKLDELKMHRDDEEVEIIDVNDYGFDYDEKARERINAAIIALELMGEEATIDWTLADNTSIPVTAAFLKLVIAKVAERSAALHIKYRNYKNTIQVIVDNSELTDEEKINQINEVSW